MFCLYRGSLSLAEMCWLTVVAQRRAPHILHTDRSCGLTGSLCNTLKSPRLERKIVLPIPDFVLLLVLHPPGIRSSSAVLLLPWFYFILFAVMWNSQRAKVPFGGFQIGIRRILEGGRERYIYLVLLFRLRSGNT